MKDSATTISKRVIKLLNLVQEHNPIARVLGDDETIQLVCPECDTNGDFIHLYAEAGRGRRIILHDDCFTTTIVMNLTEELLPEINEGLAKYGIPPLDSPRARIEVYATPDDFAEKREALAKVIFSLDFGHRVRLARLRAMKGESADSAASASEYIQVPSRPAVYLRGFLQEYHLLAKVMDDGETVQVVCPELDSEGDFIHLYVERGKGRSMVIHDAAFTLNASICLAEDNLPAANEILAAYGLPPISATNGRITVKTDRENYSEMRDALILAIGALERAYAHTQCQLNAEAAAELRDSLVRVG